MLVSAWFLTIKYILAWTVNFLEQTNFSTREKFAFLICCLVITMLKGKMAIFVFSFNKEYFLLWTNSTSKCFLKILDFHISNNLHTLTWKHDILINLYFNLIKTLRCIFPLLEILFVQTIWLHTFGELCDNCACCCAKCSFICPETNIVNWEAKKLSYFLFEVRYFLWFWYISWGMLKAEIKHFLWFCNDWSWWDTTCWWKWNCWTFASWCWG